MGLFGWLAKIFGPEPRRRGPSKSGTDRLAAMDAAYLRWLKKNNSQRWAEYMERRMAGYQPTNPLKEFIAMRKDLAAAGLIPKSEGGDTLDRLIDKLPEIASAVAPAAANVAAARAGSARSQEGSVSPPAQIEAPKRRRRPPEPEPVAEDEAAEESDSAEETSGAEEVEQMKIEVPPQLIIATVKNALDKKTPEQAAAWIRAKAREYPAAADIVKLAKETTDDQVMGRLRTYGEAAPVFAPLMGWLIARGDWTIQVARQLRAEPPKRKLRGL